MFVVFLSLCLPCLSIAFQTGSLQSYESFSDWAKRYNRTYASKEDRLQRAQNYKAYQQQVQQNALAQPDVKYGMDMFADWSPEELRGLRGLTFDGNMTYRDPSHVFEGFSEIPVQNNVIDWVKRGAVTTPTSQGRCATCQDFSAVADLEGAWFLAGHPLVKLSEQELIDCGGGDGYGMKWVISHGIARNADVPLANHSDPNITGCRQVTNCTRAISLAFTHITGVSCMTNHNETQILALLQTGPVSVSIAAHNFGGYKGGIIDCDANGIDHAVTLVGYGVDNGTAYWKLKNSWGPAFGEGGYFRFKFGNLCLRGPCRAYIGKPPVTV